MSASTSSATAADGAPAKEMQVHFLAELPLDPQVRIGGDSGKPIVLRAGRGRAFPRTGEKRVARAEEASKEEGPKIEISE